MFVLYPPHMMPQFPFFRSFLTFLSTHRWPHYTLIDNPLNGVSNLKNQQTLIDDSHQREVMLCQYVNYLDLLLLPVSNLPFPASFPTLCLVQCSSSYDESLRARPLDGDVTFEETKSNLNSSKFAMSNLDELFKRI